MYAEQVRIVSVIALSPAWSWGVASEDAEHVIEGSHTGRGVDETIAHMRRMEERSSRISVGGPGSTVVMRRAFVREVH